MTCEELEELAGALALGAAPPDEAEAARAHLASCPSAHALLRELTAVVALLAEAAEPVEPPARLRANLLAAARADSTAPERSALPPLAVVPSSTVARPETAQRGSASAQVAELPRRRFWQGSVPGWLAAAAVLVVAVGLGIWNANLRRDIDARDSLLAERQQAIDTLARAGDANAKALKVLTPELSDVHATVFRPTQGNPQLLVAGLHQPEDGKVYQLWAIRGGAAQDLGLLTPDAKGNLLMTLPDLSGVEALAVTLEPRRLPQPSGPKVLEAPLTVGIRPMPLAQLYVSQ